VDAGNQAGRWRTPPPPLLSPSTEHARHSPAFSMRAGECRHRHRPPQSHTAAGAGPQCSDKEEEKGEPLGGSCRGVGRSWTRGRPPWMGATTARPQLVACSLTPPSVGEGGKHGRARSGVPLKTPTDRGGSAASATSGRPPDVSGAPLSTEERRPARARRHQKTDRNRTQKESTLKFSCTNYGCFLNFGRCEQEQQQRKQPRRPMGATEK